MVENPAFTEEARFLRLFPQERANDIAQLLFATQDKADQVVADLRARTAPMFASPRARRAFETVCVPGMQDAWMLLLNQDAAGFVAFARRAGEQLARAGIPLAAYVTYLRFLKESYLKVHEGASQAVLDQVMELTEAIHSTLIGIVAACYYRTPARDRERVAPPVATFVDDGAPFYGMVGRSSAMHRVFDKIRRVARAASPVLILGETGTGKELVARAIHRAGARAAGPFIALNCAALPRELIESELFGYRRGAFSGAVAECLGLVRAAAGGTLLLDEVTEMAPELQAKLLRVIQDRTVRPVGAVDEVPVDVRVVASSNRDPDAAMAGGLLRPDLYYRLSSGTIVLPPLRQRPEDIAPLVAHCLRQLAEQDGGRPGGVPRVTPEALAVLEAQPWPGNARELFNVVEQAFTMAGGPEIGAGDLALAVEPLSPAAPLTLDAAQRDIIEVSEGVVCDGGASAGQCEVPFLFGFGPKYPGGLPAPNANTAGETGPETGMIVKFNPGNGRWEDTLGRNWNNAVKFSLPDLDVFAINATATTPSQSASFASVGTTIFGMATNPVSGKLYVSNTDARNEVRFEGPGTIATTVQGRLAQARITVISGSTVTPRHLNKHIDYNVRPAPAGVKDKSLATPTGMAVSSNGQTLYVAAFSSNKVGVLARVPGRPGPC